MSSFVAVSEVGSSSQWSLYVLFSSIGPEAYIITRNIAPGHLRSTSHRCREAEK